jgi:hypothetical protein
MRIFNSLDCNDVLVKVSGRIESGFIRKQNLNLAVRISSPVSYKRKSQKNVLQNFTLGVLRVLKIGIFKY